MQTPVYEDTPQLDWWLRAIFIGVPAAFLISGIAVLSSSSPEAFTLFGVGVFEACLFKAILPSRYQIFPEHIRIVLGGPLAVNIPFSRVKTVRRGSHGFTPTINFVTSARGVVEIVRVKGMAIAISPAKTDLFLDRLALYLGKDKIEI